MIEDKNFVLVNWFGGTGHHASVKGPFTFAEADSLLQRGATICGDYFSSRGYHSNLPCWNVSDDYGWYMVKIKGDFEAVLRELREEMDA